MLTEIDVNFATQRLAEQALTRMKKQYHLALRGSVPITHFSSHTDISRYRLHVNLDGSGFSGAEFASAIRQLKLHQEETNDNC